MLTNLVMTKQCEMIAWLLYCPGSVAKNVLRVNSYTVQIKSVGMLNVFYALLP